MGEILSDDPQIEHSLIANEPGTADLSTTVRVAVRTPGKNVKRVNFAIEYAGRNDLSYQWKFAGMRSNNMRVFNHVTYCTDQVDSHARLCALLVETVHSQQADSEVQTVVNAWKHQQQETKMIAFKISGTRTHTKGSYSGD